MFKNFKEKSPIIKITQIILFITYSMSVKSNKIA